MTKSVRLDGSGEARKADGADIIFHSGKIYTVDGRTPWAEAVAVKNQRIVFVGTDKSVQSLKDRRRESSTCKTR